jgi:hypothetical protein
LHPDPAIDDQEESGQGEVKMNNQFDEEIEIIEKEVDDLPWGEESLEDDKEIDHFMDS